MRRGAAPARPRASAARSRPRVFSSASADPPPADMADEILDDRGHSLRVAERGPATRRDATCGEHGVVAMRPAPAPAAESLSADASDRGGTTKSLTTQEGVGRRGWVVGKGRPGDARARFRYGKDEMNEKNVTNLRLLQRVALLPLAAPLRLFALLHLVASARRAERKRQRTKKKRKPRRWRRATPKKNFTRKKNQKATDAFAPRRVGLVTHE